MRKEIEDAVRNNRIIVFDGSKGDFIVSSSIFLQSRLTLTTDRFDLIQGRINLFKALGGEIP